MRGASLGTSAGSSSSVTSLISALEEQEIGVHGHDQLKTAPRGYPADHPRIHLLRNKGLIAWREWPVERWLTTPEAKRHLSGFLVATRPLAAWLDANVGPSQLEPAGRR